MLDESRLYYMKLKTKGNICFYSVINEIWDKRIKWFNLYDGYETFLKDFNNEYISYNDLNNDAEIFLENIFKILSNDKKYLLFNSFYPKDYNTYVTKSKHFNVDYGKKMLVFDLRKAIFQICKSIGIDFYNIIDSLNNKTLIKESTLYINLYNYSKSPLDVLKRWYPYYYVYCNNPVFKSIIPEPLHWYTYAASLLYKVYKSDDKLFTLLRNHKCPYYIRGDRITYIINNCYDEVMSIIDFDNDIDINGCIIKPDILTPHYVEYRSNENDRYNPDPFVFYYDLYNKNYVWQLTQIKYNQSYYVPQLYKVLNDLPIEEDDLHVIKVDKDLNDYVVDKINVINIIK